MTRFHFKKQIAYVGFLLMLISAACNKISAQNCTLPKPLKFQAESIGACQVTVSWVGVTGADYYGVKYKKKSSSVWSANVYIGLNTNYTFTNLEPNVKYTFAVAPFCSNNSTPGFKNLKVTTAACMATEITDVQVLSPNAAYIAWGDGTCSSKNNQLRYKRTTDEKWTIVKTADSAFVTLSNLVAGASYTCQATACKDTLGTWSAPANFVMPGRPNVLVIMLDDARYDSYSCNGGPPFFQTPNIDRIANEGANFEYSFCVQSFCIPSRGSFLTGLYPHNNGATNNSAKIYAYLPTIATILDSAGYYTGWIGKYHMAIKPQPGYDYWFATKVNSGTDEYNNMKYNVNGTLTTLNGHDTDIVTDTALSFLDKNADKNFFVTIAYHAPHNPYLPQSEFLGAYQSNTMPVPPNTQQYQSDCPSYLYQLTPDYYIQPQDVPAQYEAYYEMMGGIDVAVGKILDKMDSLSILDNTLVIFTSDNGAMFGEHGLFLKRFAYDPSSRVPLFIRFPAWFAPETMVSNEMALNVDIAPTILDAAGIPGGYHFDGFSLKRITDGQASRTAMYFESIYDTYTPELPSLRSIRTFDAKLIAYGCDSETNEYFDLANDPLENTNMINNPDYGAAVDSLKSQLNYLKWLLNDTLQETIVSCYLEPGVQKSSPMVFDPEDLPYVEDNLMIYPNPAKGKAMVGFLSSEAVPYAKITLHDALGNIVLSSHMNVVAGENTEVIDLSGLPAGFYALTVSANDFGTSRPLIIVP